MRPKTKCNIVKEDYLIEKTSIVLLVMIEIVNMTLALDQSTNVVFYMTPALLISSYLLVGVIVNIERKNGWRHSTLAFVFWLLLFLASLVTLRSKLIFQLDANSNELSKAYRQRFKLTSLELANFYMSLCLIGASMVLSTLGERRLVKAAAAASSRGGRKVAPEKNSSLLSVLTFWWINSLINTGYKRDLTREDLWEIDDTEKSENVTKKLEHVWNPKANK